MKMNSVGLVAILAAGSLLALSPALRAQEEKKDEKAAVAKAEKRGGQRPSVQERLDRMTEQLKLTDEQKPKVKAILEEQDKKMEELRQVAPEERREKGRALREETAKKMKEVLTAEQFTKWEEMRAQGRPGGPRGEKKGEGKKAEEKKAEEKK
jgi:protein CpxP